MSNAKSKTAFGADRGQSIKLLDPRPPSQGGRVIFVGYDTDDGPEHILWSKTARNAKPDPAFAEEIDERGIIEPVLVRGNGPNAEIIFGRRRLLGLRLCNDNRRARGDEPRPLPTLTFRGTDAELLELMMAENSHRADEDPIELARQINRLLQFRPKAKVALAANISLSTLNARLKLLELSPKVQAQVRDRAITPSAAVGLVELPFDEQEKQLAGLLEQQRVNGVKPTQREVTRTVNPDKAQKPTAKQIRVAMEALKTGALEDPGAEKILSWVLGQTQAVRIKGLTQVLG
jgi:ParB/RepB/Spo0J family partition protein